MLNRRTDGTNAAPINSSLNAYLYLHPTSIEIVQTSWKVSILSLMTQRTFQKGSFKNTFYKNQKKKNGPGLLLLPNKVQQMKSLDSKI